MIRYDLTSAKKLAAGRLSLSYIRPDYQRHKITRKSQKCQWRRRERQRWL